MFFFWYRPTRVVPDKRPLNGCVCVCVCLCVCVCVKGTLNVLLQSFSPTSIYCTGLQKLSIYAFTATFSNICTAYAQTGLFVNFWCKFRHHRLNRRPRFFVRVQNFCDMATFSVDFCILYAECLPYFYFRFV